MVADHAFASPIGTNPTRGQAFELVLRQSLTLSGSLSVLPSDWPMNWYDVFALFYDLVVERNSRSHRQEAARQLRLEPGLSVLDVASNGGTPQGGGPSPSRAGIFSRLGLPGQGRHARGGSLFHGGGREQMTAQPLAGPARIG